MNKTRTIAKGMRAIRQGAELDKLGKLGGNVQLMKDEQVISFRQAREAFVNGETDSISLVWIY